MIHIISNNVTLHFTIGLRLYLATSLPSSGKDDKDNHVRHLSNIKEMLPSSGTMTKYNTSKQPRDGAKLRFVF